MSALGSDVSADPIPDSPSRQTIAAMLLDGDALGIIGLTSDFHVSFANARAAEQVGLPSSKLVGQSALGFVHPEDLGVMAESLVLVTEGRATVPTIFRVMDDTGGVRSVEGTVQAQNPDSDEFRFVIVIRDPSPSLRLDEFIGATLRSNLVEGLRSLVGLIETDGDFLASIHWDWSDDRFTQVVANDAAVSRIIHDPAFRSLLTETAQSPSLNRPLRPLGIDLDGTDRRSIFTCPIGQGDHRGVVVGWLPYEGELGPAGRNFFNRTARLADFALERHIADHRLQIAANTDHLTGLGNRAALNMHLTRRLAEESGEPVGFSGATDRASGCSLLLFDLDGFKKVNDDHGHAAGDHVLVQIANRLVEGCPAESFVARLGGDEFAVVVGTEHPVDALSEGLRTELGRPIQSAFGPLEVGVSVGVATATDDSTFGELLATADRRMYENKRSRVAARAVAEHAPTSPHLLV